MNYRSISDLSDLVNKQAGKIPTDVELIVGIPRSGMLVASIIALKLNLPLIDLQSFLRNEALKRGSTRTYKFGHLQQAWDATRILLVDDSIATGAAMQEAVSKVVDVYQGAVLTFAAFATPGNSHRVDVHLEELEQPRVFEWNIMHHHFIENACLDIDGVLCEDPTPEQNDDGPLYVNFLNTAKPLFIPSVKVANLVTSRLEKYRPQTEAWLSANNVQYGQLHMLDLPTAEERRRLNIHHAFKAGVYKRMHASMLFVESEQHQAVEIMVQSNKPVYCIENNRMYVPGRSFATLQIKAVRKARNFKQRLANKVRRLLTRFTRPVDTNSV